MIDFLSEKLSQVCTEVVTQVKMKRRGSVEERRDVTVEEYLLRIIKLIYTIYEKATIMGGSDDKAKRIIHMQLVQILE